MTRYKFITFVIAILAIVSATRVSAQEKYTVTATSGAVVRDEASMTGLRLTVLPKGTELLVVGKLNGQAVRESDVWYKVVMPNGKRGLVHSSTVSKVAAEKPVTPTPTPTPALPKTEDRSKIASTDDSSDGAIRSLDTVKVDRQISSPKGIKVKLYAVKAGIAYSSMRVESVEEGNFGSKVGIALSVVAEVPFSGAFWLAPEVGITQKGFTSSWRDEFLGTTYSMNSSLVMTYLELLPLWRLNVVGEKVHPYVLAGPALSLRLHSVVSNVYSVNGVDEPSSENAGDGTRFLDLGLLIGGGVESGRLIGEVRYTHGFGEVVNDVIKQEGSAKNRLVSLMIGYRLGK